MSGVGGPSGIGSGGGGGIQQILSMRQQILDRSQLLKEVHQASQSGAAPAPAEPQGGFGTALNTALQQVSSTQNRAENLSAAYERGDVTDVAKVMLARQEAGVAFEATLQVRNRLLSAYQDIMRMGV